MRLRSRHVKFEDHTIKIESLKILANGVGPSLVVDIEIMRKFCINAKKGMDTVDINGLELRKIIFFIQFASRCTGCVMMVDLGSSRRKYANESGIDPALLSYGESSFLWSATALMLDRSFRTINRWSRSNSSQIRYLASCSDS